MSEPREIKTAETWAWVDKAALEIIRSAFDDCTFLDQALAVLLVLTELASDAGGPTFTEKKRTIAEGSGVSLRRVGEILNRFQSIGIVTWKQNKIENSKELAPSTYTLLATSCRDSTTPHAQPALGSARSDFAEIAESEKKEKETKETETNVGSAAVAAPTLPLIDEQAWLASLKADPAYKGMDVDREHAKLLRWCTENRRQPTRRRFVNWLNRADRPMTHANSNKRNDGIATDISDYSQRLAAKVAAQQKH